jgi:hypothetical protein
MLAAEEMDALLRSDVNATSAAFNVVTCPDTLTWTRQTCHNLAFKAGLAKYHELN